MATQQLLCKGSSRSCYSVSSDLQHFYPQIRLLNSHRINNTRTQDKPWVGCHHSQLARMRRAYCVVKSCYFLIVANLRRLYTGKTVLQNCFAPQCFACVNMESPWNSFAQLFCATVLQNCFETVLPVFTLTKHCCAKQFCKTMAQNSFAKLFCLCLHQCSSS